MLSRILEENWGGSLRMKNGVGYVGAIHASRQSKTLQGDNAQVNKLIKSASKIYRNTFVEDKGSKNPLAATAHQTTSILQILTHLSDIMTIQTNGLLVAKLLLILASNRRCNRVNTQALLWQQRG